MKKKIAMLLVGLMTAVASHAQFDDDVVFNQGKMYASASLSGLDFNYNGGTKWKFDGQVKGGYFVLDDLMLTGTAGFSYRKYTSNSLTLGLGGRYYIEQNGIFLGAGINYLHSNHTFDDFMPNVEVGYAFFLSRTVTIEPEIYYEQSLKDHSNYSNIGFRVGFGIYLDELF